MKPSRQLRERAKGRKSAADAPEADEPKPEGYRYAQTDGYSSTDRVSRDYEHWDASYQVVPVVMGFRPNEERS